MARVIPLIIGLCPFYERNVFYIDQEGSINTINIPASLAMADAQCSNHLILRSFIYINTTIHAKVTYAG